MMRVRLLIGLVVVGLALVAAVVEAQDCRGTVDIFTYDLAPLAKMIGDVDLQTTDSLGHVYYYHVCGAADPARCDNIVASVCQKDARPSPQYHYLGRPWTAKFHPLPASPASAGFALSFTGGEADRSATINFICDPSAEEPEFSFIKEDPIKTYDLQLVSKYACPTNVSPTSAPAPPPPPSRDDKCCLYAYNADPRHTKTLCSSACPSLSGYSLAGNWTVTTCTDCFFSRRAQ